MKKNILLLLQVLLPVLAFSQSLTSINPSTANAGQTLNVTITGSGTHFNQASNTVAFDFGQGSSTTAVNSFNTLNDTNINANITVPTNTTTGNYHVWVSNTIDGNLKLNAGFHVNGNTIPSLVAVNPDTVNAGQTLTVTITGVNTHFSQASKTTKVIFDLNQGSSTVVNSINIANDTSLTAKIIIPAYIVSGNYNITVSDSIDGELKLENAFHVNGIPAAIWREDFRNGIPASWKQSGPNQIWKHSTKPAQGKYSQGDIIKSTSTANGFMIFDADFDTIATNNHTVPLEGSIITSPIDLTGHYDVKLSFQQFFRLCCESDASLMVSISTNDTAWTDLDAIGNIDNNTYSPNPDKKIFNISEVAGNKSNVKLKFTFKNATSYHWQVDDIAITTAPNNDINLRRAYTDFGFTNGGNYTKLPLSQASPISFRGAIFNDGAMSQTDAKLKVNVSFKATTSSPAKEVYADSSQAKIIDRLAEDTLFIENSFIPTEVGKYTSSFVFAQSEIDEVPANNTIVKTFDVTDSVYARDNGIYNATKFYLRQYSSTAEGIAMGTLFDVFKEAYPTSVSVFINTSTALGVSFRYVIYELTASDVVEVFSSDIYDVTSTKNKNKWITLPIINAEGAMLNANATYLVGVETIGGTSDVNALAVSSDKVTEQPGSVSLLRVKDNSGSSWGFMSGVPLIRLNLNETIKLGVNNLAKNTMNLYQNIPNPASKETVIGYELVSNSKVSLKVFDITGKEMMFINEGEKSPGKHSIRLNTSKLSSGVYYYTINDGQTNMTKKMIISE